MASLLLAIIYLCFISLGLPDSLLGSAWPALYQSLNVPISYMSYISMTISLMTIISSLACDFLRRKLGSGLLCALSILFTCIGLIGFSFCSKYYMFFIAAIPYGLGAGAIDATLNNYVALHFKAKHMSWLHCMWGIGASISPNIMSFALSHQGWQQGYLIVFIVQTVIAFIVFMSLPLWKKFEIEKKEKTDDAPSIGVIGVLKLKGAILMFIAFFCYCSLEQTVLSWSATYFVLKDEISSNLAASFASLGYIGMTVGRFFCGFLTMKFKDKQLIFVGSSIILIGLILLLISPNYIVSVIAIAIIGLGCAPIYPSIIHSTPTLFGRNNSLSMIGVQMAFAYVASLIVPPLFGKMIEHVGAWTMPYILLFFLFFLVLFYYLVDKVRKKEMSKEASL